MYSYILVVLKIGIFLADGFVTIYHCIRMSIKVGKIVCGLNQRAATFPTRVASSQIDTRSIYARRPDMRFYSDVSDTMFYEYRTHKC